MPTILLIRHGQASFGAADYDQLSVTGVAQAQAVAKHLSERGLRVERTVSGGLRRQRDTAVPAGERFGREVEVDPRWDEYAMDEIIAAHSPTPARASASAGDSGEEISARHYQLVLEQALAAWIAAGRDEAACESWPAFLARTRAALDEVATSLGHGTTALVFTSGGVVAALAVTLLGLPATAMLTLNRVAVNTGITKLICGRRGITLVSFNEHGHLELDRQAITYR